MRGDILLKTDTRIKRTVALLVKNGWCVTDSGLWHYHFGHKVDVPFITIDCEASPSYESISFYLSCDEEQCAVKLAAKEVYDLLKYFGLTDIRVTIVCSYSPFHDNTIISINGVTDLLLTKLKVEQAAIQQGGIVFTLPKPARHNDIIRRMVDRGLEVKDCVQGFILNDGNFVDRYEAKIVAINAEQQLNRASDLPELFSEDVW